jgi:chemotaxis protein methyltransferase CheR
VSLLDQLNLGGSAGASGLSQATFEELRRFVHERTGIYFRDNKRYLMESRLSRRLTTLGLADFEAYLRFLQTPAARAELTELANAVTINETYFFRHAEQHALFVKEILPTLVESRLSRGQRRVRLWSAASSTGDEAYTLALLILENLRARYPQVTFEIVGTDIDTEVVARARRGEYGAYAVRNVPPELLQKYFVPTGDGRTESYRLDAKVRSMVSFRQTNLADRVAMGRMRDVDAAFCANVLIYFDQAVKERVVGSLYQSLREGGYLFVGVSETLYGVTQAFQPVRFAQAVAYRKEAPASAVVSPTAGLGATAHRSALHAPNPYA